MCHSTPAKCVHDVWCEFVCGGKVVDCSRTVTGVHIRDTARQKQETFFVSRSHARVKLSIASVYSCCTICTRPSAYHNCQDVFDCSISLLKYSSALVNGIAFFVGIQPDGVQFTRIIESLVSWTISGLPASNVRGVFSSTCTVVEAVRTIRSPTWNAGGWTVCLNS